jgi:hypothetical protein
LDVFVLCNFHPKYFYHIKKIERKGWVMRVSGLESDLH